MSQGEWEETAGLFLELGLDDLLEKRKFALEHLCMLVPCICILSYKFHYIA